jgi:origin recognition complex subunit 2
MAPELESFHLSCRDELNVLLGSFNILFYGYGSKERMLKRLFPGSLVFNCRVLRVREILDGVIEGVRRLHPEVELGTAGSIRDMDGLLSFRAEKLKLVLLNFDFEQMAELSGLRNIALVATVERTSITFSSEDVERYNFIFRDLTTYEPYSTEIHGIQLNASKSDAAASVIRNVSRNSRAVMEELLDGEGAAVAIDELFERVKRRLFLRSKNAIFPLISEFVDHNILKLKDNAEIVVNLSLADRKAVIKKLEEPG